LFYLKNKNICDSDIEVAFGCRNLKINCLAGLGGVKYFLYLIVFDKYYRNLFYKRIGRWHYLVFPFAPAHDCFSIGTYMKLGKGMYCNHPFSTVINAKEVGDNFFVAQNVTVGNNHGIPSIGNNVAINVNCVVVGDIRIGNNVTIGACSLIMHDVPDNCVVVGNPARIIRKDGNKCDMLLKEYITAHPLNA
jgi:serine O-acetyltransferase